MTLYGEESTPRLKMAIQKGGRMTEQTIALLRGIDLDFDAYGQRLYSTVQLPFRLEVSVAERNLPACHAISTS